MPSRYQLRNSSRAEIVCFLPPPIYSVFSAMTNSWSVCWEIGHSTSWQMSSENVQNWRKFHMFISTFSSACTTFWTTPPLGKMSLNFWRNQALNCSLRKYSTESTRWRTTRVNLQKKYLLCSDPTSSTSRRIQTMTWTGLFKSFWGNSFLTASTSLSIKIQSGTKTLRSTTLLRKCLEYYSLSICCMWNRLIWSEI